MSEFKDTGCMALVSYVLRCTCGIGVAVVLLFFMYVLCLCLSLLSDKNNPEVRKTEETGGRW